MVGVQVQGAKIGFVAWGAKRCQRNQGWRSNIEGQATTTKVEPWRKQVLRSFRSDGELLFRLFLRRSVIRHTDCLPGEQV